MAKRQTLGRGLSALFGEAEAAAIAPPGDGGLAPTVSLTPVPSPAASSPAGSSPGAAAVGAATSPVPTAQGPAEQGFAAQGSAAQASSGIRMLAVDHMAPSPYQPRRIFDEGGLNELAESVRHRGVLQPLLVRPNADEPGRFEIVAGERRWRAAQKAQIHEVPVLVRELSDRETLEIALVENLQRQDLNPMEEAEGYRRLVDEFAHTQEALAEVVGKSRSHVANTMRLLSLPDEVCALVSDGSLSAGHARALLTLDNPTETAREVVKKGLSVRQTEALAREVAQRIVQPRPRKASAGGAGQAEKDADTLALEHDLSAQLGMKVTITMKGVNGSQGILSVHYASLSQLDEVLARLSQAPARTHDHDDGHDDQSYSPFG